LLDREGTHQRTDIRSIRALDELLPLIEQL
jgi:hypothetical protein